jgi:hypothetical protein
MPRAPYLAFALCSAWAATALLPVLLPVSATGQTSPLPAGHAAAAPNSALPEDHHEGMSLSADAYADAARCKDKFGKANPYPVGILPVEIFLRNETDHAIKIDLSAVQLTVHAQSGPSQDVDWLTAEEVATAIAHPKGPGAPHASRLPIPIPSAGGDSKVDKLVAVLQPLMLDADVVPPQAQVRGFLFFDVNRDFSRLQSSSVYLPDAKEIPANKPLLFFEVPLAKGASK